jgi:HK97 family phage major capsid protein
MTTNLKAASPENKAMAPGASNPQINTAMDEFMRSFDSFKQANDDRLDQFEKRMSVDVITTEKVDRINAALDSQKQLLDQLSLMSSRPHLSGEQAGVSNLAALQHKSAWDSYMRKGDNANLRTLEQKALSIQVDADGGYLVPDDTEREISRALSEASPIRAISGIRQVSSTIYKKPYTLTGPATGWVGETDVRPETTSPTLTEMQFPTMELYAMPAASSALLDDSAVDIDQWIAEEVQIAFAEQEGTAFVVGDGVNKPRGFLDYNKVDNSLWSWGNIGYTITGTSGGFAASNPGDGLVDLIYSVKSGYRANAHMVMNRSTQAEIRKLKDADGHYLWQPGIQAGAPATLLNIAIAESEDMADIGVDSYAIAYGDFNRGYLIVDRVGVRVLRDPYSSKPYVLFYTTKRVGGGVQNFEAIKLLKFGTA